MKKTIFFVTLFFASQLVSAHEGGHAIKTKGIGKHGGLLAAVMKVNDIQDHHGLYQAELTRLKNGTVRLYLYDHHGILILPDRFDKKASANIHHKTKTEKISFSLTHHKNHFLGTVPPIKKRPFNIAIDLTEKGKKLRVVFKNLD